ncbi:MAG: choice-of-anchor Q domain-containing protein [Pyrinomonadaceae bacterium]
MNKIFLENASFKLAMFPLPVRSNRRFSQLFLLSGLLLLFFGIGSISSAATFTVTKTADTDDGSCDADCSLREAVGAANSAAGDDLIQFDPGLFGTSQIITLGGTQIEVNNNGALVINGPGAGLLKIANGFNDRIFLVNAGADLSVEKLTLSEGDADSGGAVYNFGTLTIADCVVRDNTSVLRGGAIYNNEGNLTIVNSEFRGNSTLNSGGGAVSSLLGTVSITGTHLWNNSAGSFGGALDFNTSTVSINNSAVTNNSAVNAGGGIAASGSSVLTITNSTVSQNQVVTGGGGIANLTQATTSLISSTVAGNTADSDNDGNGAGGGISNSGTFQAINSIIADNSSNSGLGPDFEGIFTSQGYNLIENTNKTTITGDITGNITGQDPLLGGLQNNGGLLPTHALMSGSPAIDAGDPVNFPSSDQRGVVRPVDGDGDGSALPDIGSFELNNRWVVTKTADTDDGTCDADCSLREAVSTANSTAGDDLIEFDPGVFGTLQRILLDGSELRIKNNGALTIHGTGTEMLFIDGNARSRILFIEPSAQIRLENLTVSGGSGQGIYPGGFGGGIYNRGILTLSDSSVINNSALSGGGIFGGSVIAFNSRIENNLATDGGGISEAVWFIQDSVISNNRASNKGGAGYFVRGVVQNTNIAGNLAGNEGGAIYMSGDMTLTRVVLENNAADTGGAIFCADITGLDLSIFQSTIRNNSANSAGGIYNYATTDIYDTTISQNTANDIGGGFFNRRGPLILFNSTIYGNSAGSDGGGIYNRSDIVLKNVTVAANHAVSGAGIISLSTGTASVRNSLFADNLTNSSQEDFFGTMDSGGYNLIESLENTNLTGDQTGNIIGNEAGLDPRGLRNNGGPTQTVALLPDSPAVDAALSTGEVTLSADQRGRIRPVDFPDIPNAPGGDATDIGSFERQTDDVISTFFDFDGDGRADVSIFRPSAGEWWYLRSSDGTNRTFQFGTSTDHIVPADYTGDGRTDVAFWRESSGEWFILRSEDDSFYSFPFGAPGDVPVAADFDGDGRADAAVFRPGNATWFINRSSDGGTTITQFGALGDLPVAGDYDGDGRADVAIFRPADGSWWLNRSAAGLAVYNFGTGEDRVVPADYTGDGKTDVAFWRPSTGEWFIFRSEDNSFYSFPFGAVGDLPVPADYDGDGRTDPAVFRPGNNVWYQLQTTGGFKAVTFGANEDIPVPGAFVR